MADNNIIHIGAVRSRVVGTGNLKQTFYGFDKIQSATVADVVMAEPNARMSNRLCNFTNEFIILRGETTLINEYFRFNDITIYVKPIYTELPSGS